MPRSTKARRVCKVCGLVLLGTYPAAERHMDSHGGGRLECGPDEAA